MSSNASTLSSEDTLLSNVHRGTAFENRAMLMLRNLSMSLSRIGGRNDGGIDLQGWWWVPYPSPIAHEQESGSTTDGVGIPRRRIRVLAQCKAERKKLGPNYVREMEGVLHRHLHLPGSEEERNTKLQPTVALLVSESAFTKATILCAMSSPLPFFLLHLPRVTSSHPTQTSDKESDSASPLDSFGSAIWNPALGGSGGVLGGDVDLRWEMTQTPMIHSRPSLWWHGKRLESWAPILEE
ncbi:uncharacterized protein FOMMEDRAFT_77750 [Fomitiporia mediterranea MF3/22]|uniref:uncharacterized protein n=1 Tax=Fomitiporia mediterranea (strain MF3/22) TaxID=694068 RepID=UPI0004408296|nr:uncharacterized protein FOMMEDRAFT_77750 [Fomitiporia mediterranea MF3/22]EJD05395.1 hypothetical protein FOMMEDRAFT_77750 [Fomitiporia mediterranea MF3/22]